MSKDAIVDDELAKKFDTVFVPPRLARPLHPTVDVDVALSLGSRLRDKRDLDNPQLVIDRR